MATLLLTLANALVAVRRLYQDTSTTNPGVTDPILTERMNDYLSAMWNKVDRRAIVFNGTAAFADAANNSKSVLGAPQNVVEWERVLRGATFAAGVPMEGPLPLHKILALQNSDSTTGTPTKYALERVGVGSGTSGNSTVGIWRLYLHPISNGVFSFSARAFIEAPILATGAGFDTPDITREQQQVLIRLTALDGAHLTRRPQEFVQRIERLIPERYRELIHRPDVDMGQRRARDEAA